MPTDERTYKVWVVNTIATCASAFTGLAALILSIVALIVVL